MVCYKYWFIACMISSHKLFVIVFRNTGVSMLLRRSFTDSGRRKTLLSTPLFVMSQTIYMYFIQLCQKSEVHAHGNVSWQNKTFFHSIKLHKFNMIMIQNYLNMKTFGMISIKIKIVFKTVRNHQLTGQKYLFLSVFWIIAHVHMYVFQMK